MITLYKKDTTGKTRIANFFTEGGDLIQQSGVLGGALVTHRKTCKAKNEGRSNATTPEQQAISEMNSKIAEQLKGGYFRTLEELESAVVILPMLAKDYAKEKKKIDWSKGVYAQPKFDGMRCLAIIKGGKVTLMSRAGTEIENMEHIKDALVLHLSGFTFNEIDIVLDGELYCHGISFQENMKLIKKYREGESEKVKYHVYDIVDTFSFAVRQTKLSEILSLVYSNSIVPVYTVPVNNETALNEFHSKILAEGYEGSMVRHGVEGYKIDGRSSSLLKKKDFLDSAAPVKDVIPSDARPDQGVLVCELQGKIFKASLKMTHEQRAEVLQNKENYIGQTAEIRYFELTDDGIPRFPVCVGFRLDK